LRGDESKLKLCPSWRRTAGQASSGTRFGKRFFIFLLATLFAAPALAADDDDDDELPDYRPGLVATYQAADEKPIVRRDNDVQFVWRDASPDPRLPSGPFKARWQGRLFTMSPGKHQLHVYAQGKVRLKIAGKTWLDQTLESPKWIASEPLTLEYGYHPLELDFEKTGSEARIGLYWSGPQFQLEPLTERNLVHEPGHAPDESFERGRLLARALRCDACHGTASSNRLTAPDLTRLAGNVSPGWIVDLLMSGPHKPAHPDADEPIDRLTRRMPYLGMPEDDAQAIAAFLLAGSAKPPAIEATKSPVAKKKAETKKPKVKGKKNSPPPRTEPSAAEGQNLADTVGCLACHRIAERGSTGFFGGTDLSHVASKRPSDFFARWLADPAAINPAHRMPVFPLSELERQDLALYLATLKGEDFPSLHGPVKSSADFVERGRQLVGQWRCGACHQLPAGAATAAAKLGSLNIKSRWSDGCLDGDRWPIHRPGYSSLFKSQRQALERYYSQSPAGPAAAIDGQFVLAERNCLGCHARGLSLGLAGQSARLTAARPELAPLLPALAPPSLSGVGDKLHDEALQAAILLKHPPLRPWLKIRMPKFPLADDEMHAIVHALIDHDRVPPLPEPPPSNPTDPATVLAGSRLVTSDGFGCTSCHKIGSSEPVQVALAAHGTELSMVGSRIRRPWFDRWVRNPARIVPRMEMPAIKIPVSGLLHNDIDVQLVAVWNALNTKGFEPPLPNPVRVVRSAGGWGGEDSVLTDAIELDKATFLQPIVVGLTIRQNLLFDLETNRMAAWWLGDTARQRTRGKSWYWEVGSPPLLPLTDKRSELRIKRGDRWVEPRLVGQVRARLETFEHPKANHGRLARLRRKVAFKYQLEFESADGSGVRRVRVSQTIEIFQPVQLGPPGFRREITILDPIDEPIYWYPLPGGRADVKTNSIVALEAGGVARISVHVGQGLTDDGGVLVSGIAAATYHTRIPVDTFPTSQVPFPPETPAKLKVVPGYEAIRLPLARDEMPTGLAWRPDGTLVISSLKGRVCLLRDTDGDGLEDEIKPFSDDLAAPYGVNCSGKDIDVINKYGLLRLYDSDGDGHAEKTEVLADGWGYTADYHDWAVGLPRDAQGNYYVALPCQQDERSEAAARWRGWALKLVPRTPTADDPRRFAVERFAGGLRFPMGLALNRAGDLFATDNQGNYTPFNELNQLSPGTRYGFINKLEVKPGFAPPFKSAAIEIPHPWTRSINGICFLYTPEAVQKKLGRPLFGPFEGQLVGCEYNNRALVRMSLERIGDTYQGAVYPLSRPPAEGEETFEGPVVCAVAPDGDLYIGNLRDSAWGGGQNTGSIVRLRPEGPLPPGIAEVRAAHDGFSIHFTQPLERAAAADTAHYSVVSYRRLPTPAYGGLDADTKTARVRSVAVSDDGLSARLVLDEMRPGFVYEIRLTGLDSGGQPMFPAEAYYTLRQVPK
jgi:cytochrome c551/c552